MTDSSGSITASNDIGYTTTNSITLPGWASITGGTSAASTDYRIVVTTGAGTETTIAKKPTEKRISPSLYFKYVKSKLNKNEVQKLKIRLGKLQTLTKDAFDLNQQALYEEYSKMMAITVRESEAYACGYDTWINIKDIQKYMGIAKESGGHKSVVYFKKLEDFPRSIPPDVKKEIEQAKDKGVFDQLWVLYLDYTHEEIKTNKEKIREKDPILLGQFSYAKDKYYYLTDWIDEHCDLTLDDFVTKMKHHNPDFEVNKTPEIDEAFIERIKQEVADRQARLDGTKRDNFKSLMEEEDRNNGRPAPLKPSGPGVSSYEPKKLPWYKRMFGAKEKDETQS